MDELKKLHVDGTDYQTRLTRKYAARADWRRPDPSQLRSVIPGLVLEVKAKPGQKVRRGDVLLVLEAMKMQNPVAAPRDGVVAAVAVTAGQTIPKNTLLFEFEK